MIELCYFSSHNKTFVLIQTNNRASPIATTEPHLSPQQSLPYRHNRASPIATTDPHLSPQQSLTYRHNRASPIATTEPHLSP